MTFERDQGKRSATGSTRSQPAARRGNPVLGLQRVAGNRGTGQVLARRKGGEKKGTFEHSVKLGDTGPIEIVGGNVGEWASGKNPDDLVVTSTAGKHSKELERLSKARARVDTTEVQSIVGENSFVNIKFGDGRVTGFSTDGKTDSWKLTDFASVKRHRTSIGKHRP